MIGPTTLDNVGVKTVTITGTDTSARCTVLLGVTLTGEKLPPFIIFKGIPNGRVAQEVSQVDSNVVCTVQKNAWMDETSFLFWTESIWNKFSSSLLLDSYAVHETAAIKEALGKHGTKFLYIPRGFTSRLQVLDVGVNKPFKQYMRQQFERPTGGTHLI